jgi:hypothetical protein
VVAICALAAIACGAPASAPSSSGPLTGVVVASADAEVAIELRGIL